MIKIRPPREGDSPKAFLSIINELIAEDTYILREKKLTLKAEKTWLKAQLGGIKEGNIVMFNAWIGSKIVASCAANRGTGKEKQNVLLGMMVRKDYRRKGLGELLLCRTIATVKKKLKPKHIYLSVIDGNKPAMNLYKKVGFREIARLPGWFLHRGKYHDSVFMLLKK
ncbi:MAG: GNAT family N-acetyltransferase [Candidatus Micrarchaeia archaeon]|jgi:RimJ/RimL family protein N-acetyltransferase